MRADLNTNEMHVSDLFLLKELVLDVVGHRAAPTVCRADRYIDFVILLLNGNAVLHKYQVQHGRSTLTRHLQNC